MVELYLPAILVANISQPNLALVLILALTYDIFNASPKVEGLAAPGVLTRELVLVIDDRTECPQEAVHHILPVKLWIDPFFPDKVAQRQPARLEGAYEARKVDLPALE